MKNKDKHQTKIVYTNFVADWLIRRGEKFLYVRQDLKYPDRNVFVFENSSSFDRNFRLAVEDQLRSKGLKIKK